MVMTPGHLGASGSIRLLIRKWNWSQELNRTEARKNPALARAGWAGLQSVSHFLTQQTQAVCSLCGSRVPKETLIYDHRAVQAVTAMVCGVGSQLTSRGFPGRVSDSRRPAPRPETQTKGVQQVPGE